MLKELWRLLKAGWMKFAEALGWFNTRLLLGLTYIVIIGPISIILFILRKDPLRKRLSRKQESYWINKKPVDHSLDAAKHQF